MEYNKNRRPNFSWYEVEALIGCVRKNSGLNVSATGPECLCKTPRELREAWEEVAKTVSSIAVVTRNGKEIKDKWSDLKCRVKKKSANLHVGMKTTGVGGAEKSLTRLEEKLLTFVAPSTIEGIPGGVSSLSFQQVGIIGGSGLDDPDIFQERKELSVSSPFGKPSDVLIEGKIKGVPCVLLARHGRNHSIMPSNVNYQANIWALKEVGCTHILATTACGSLREDIHPGELVFIDQFIDRTTKRKSTFYDGAVGSPKGVCHIPMHTPFCPHTRKLLIDTAKELDLPLHEGGTIVTIEGPRFSSKAESHMFRSWNADLINMTTVPEVVLAKEAGILYASIALPTDYDCWYDSKAAQTKTGPKD